MRVSSRSRTSVLGRCKGVRVRVVGVGVNVRGEEPAGRERRFEDLGWCVVSSEPAYGFKRRVWGSGKGVE